jgi:hypothetical protein
VQSILYRTCDPSQSYSANKLRHASATAYVASSHNTRADAILAASYSGTAPINHSHSLSGTAYSRCFFVGAKKRPHVASYALVRAVEDVFKSVKELTPLCLSFTSGHLTPP